MTAALFGITSVFGLSVGAAAASFAIVYLGAVVQSTIGIGLGLLAAPVLAIADRDFVPAVIVIIVFPLTLMVVAREHRAVDRRGVGFALIGRVPGVAIGAAAVTVAGPKALALLVGGSVLLAVLTSLTKVRFRTTPPALVTAGLASGFAGTATGIGGPPMALTYQHQDPAVMRSTISAFFAVGTLLSIGALMISGELGTRQWQLSLLVLPAVGLGFLTSQVFARRLRSDRLRPMILVLCTASAIALLVKEFA